MMQNCYVCQFLENKPLKNQILTTNYWTVGIIPNQPYLGRGLITLLDHKSSLGKLTHEDTRYGSFYDDGASRPVGQEVIEEIVQRLKAHLT